MNLERLNRHVPIWNNMNTDVFDRMAAAGYHPNTITEVFCTHLHDDHCGGCTKFVDGRWVPTFKNAEYVYNITEFDYWRVTEYKGGDEVFQDSVKPIIDAGLAKFVDPLKYQLCPGVRFESTPGHTPGHVSVIVESGGKRAIVTGDMIHNPLQIAEPRVTSHFDWNSAIAVETRLAFLKKWTDGETIIIGTHFGK